MDFWIFMFICNSMIPVVMIVFGRVMWKHPPKKINDMYGYRTTMSMKNMDTWKFAHEYSGKLWWKAGWIMLIPSVLIQLSYRKSNEDVTGIAGAILCLIQCVVLVLCIIPVEKALKRAFDKDGHRKGENS